MRHDIGKKGKYKRDYSEKLVEYFNHRAEGAGKKSAFPTLSGFAESIGARLSDIFLWSDTVEEFSRSLELAKRCKREYVLDGVLDGSITASAAKFIIDEYDSCPSVGEKGDASFVLKVSFEDGAADIADVSCAAGGAVRSDEESERDDAHE